ncbi:MAG: gfo/Idh/MocA family oxidoreductase, partial [Pirellulaceae bacterium]|nr:gfo/Idh/MocA family oxidoreductase [Pirellulaceae bacterium]
HVANFLECVKSRRLTRANASVAGQSHIVCHAAYIAWQLGRTLKFDPVKEEFIGDEEANRMRSRATRAPWTV